jgi:hypothetical protein
MSLNNLGVNAARLMSVDSQSSADECLSEGAQDVLFENRPTSLLTPQAIGSLEFSALFPSGGQGGHHQPSHLPRIRQTTW